jgi:hypothetical protein
MTAKTIASGKWVSEGQMEFGSAFVIFLASSEFGV